MLKTTTAKDLIEHLEKLDPETPLFEEDTFGNLFPITWLPDYIEVNPERDAFEIVKEPEKANGLRYMVTRVYTGIDLASE